MAVFVTDHRPYTPRRLALLLTVLTGMTGLVYEVAWQRYLATLLGSHSEATAAVLAIFLAGMSAGYAAFGRLSKRLVARGSAESSAARLLRAYGIVEASIGAFAWVFPLYFDAVQSLSTALPESPPAIGFALDVALAALLIGPPTALMGATIPMLTQALSRSLADASPLHALVYSLNTLGATLGALAAGFALIPWLGLARVMFAMGTINLVAGATFVRLASRAGAVSSLERGEAAAHPPGGAAYSAVALLIGFAMMAIQTILNRLGALSLGASEFTFATIVAVNVLCIALGSLAVTRAVAIPRRVLAWNVWLLFAGFAGLYLVLDQAPYWMHLLRLAFGDGARDFYAFHLAVFAATLAAVGAPILFAGAALPLLFHHLREEAGDLGALAGRIYSWNTVGSLAGALLGGYALLSWLDLHHVYRIAVAALLGAAVLTTVAMGALSAKRAGVIAGVALLGLSALPPWSQRLLSAGLFRVRRADAHSYDGPRAAEAAGFYGSGGEVVFYDDDPALSAAVIEWSRPQLARSIINNGKSDGSTYADYPTMALLAVVPTLMHPGPESAFVIGLGTGVTVGELLQLGVERVRVVEISRGVMRAAPLFDFANFQVSQSPQVEIVHSDAYRALLRSRERYDLILSEPSNPWGTGVEMLFSAEFLAAGRAHLAPGGIFVQWTHTYEIDSETIRLVLRTYASVFDRVAVWYAGGSDLFLLGFDAAHPGYSVETVRERASQPQLVRALARSGIDSFEELLVHELFPIGVVNALGLTGPLHTLHHPRLAHLAGRAFFRGAAGRLPFIGFGEPARVAEDHSLFRQLVRSRGGALSSAEYARAAEEACTTGRREMCTALLASWYRADPESQELAAAVGTTEQPRKIFAGAPNANPFRQLSELMARSGSELPRYSDAEGLTRLYATYYRPHAPLDPAVLLRAWQECGPPDHTADACRLGLERARALVERGVTE